MEYYFVKIMYKETFVIGFIVILISKEYDASVLLRRFARGLLSRTGLCPNPRKNYQTKDNRLNLFGVAHILPPDHPLTKPCQENECNYDSECHGDKRCCRNICGASVCTVAMRDPHPCTMFKCPKKKVCNLRKVRCIFPNCTDLLAVKRPICVLESKILNNKQ